jgi:cephalosporin-C deacetylase
LKHPFPFDPTYGYDEAKLLTVPSPPGPTDFAEFWQRTFWETMAVPLKLERREIKSPHPDFELEEIEFDSLGGVRIGGWLSRPRSGSIEHGMVIGHGYGGRDVPAFERGAAVLAPCARGFNRSAQRGIPGDAAHHVLHGIKDRETYCHRGSVADLWSAASALLEVFPEVAPRLHYSGCSFGGGIGAMALPWDRRFRKAFLEVPSFGNHPLRLQMPGIGSGEAVRCYHRRHPEVTEVLAYFDSATAARYITIPVLVAAALFDPAVPPPGQFAVYNGLGGPKELFIRQYGHFESPNEAKETRDLLSRLDAWWKNGALSLGLLRKSGRAF